jgi:adenine-specific DNA-methyltransferase
VSDRSRLELTWPNKDKYLLSPSGDNGEPVWVERDDPRATTIPHATFTDTVGDVSDNDPHSDNLLCTGDSLDVLRALKEHPEYRSHYRGNVRLVYIDPPFNTGQAFTNYRDQMEHATWLSFMQERLLIIHDVLSADGSVWVHLDDVEAHRMRCVLDEIFGADNFVADMCWQRFYTPSNSNKYIAPQVDHILVYARDKERFHVNRLPRNATNNSVYKNPDNDPRGPYLADNYTQNKTREQSPGCWYPIVRPADGKEIWPNVDRVWAYNRERHTKNVADNRVHWGRNGTRNTPTFKRFLSEVGGVVPGNWLSHTEVGHTNEAKQHIKKLFPGTVPFSTPKPERLLERVLHIGSNPDDIVMDVFAGSGTTPAVAHKMGRRWVAAEILPETVNTFTKPRLEKVVAGDDPGGITSTANWASGGGFRTVTVTPPPRP